MIKEISKPNLTAYEAILIIFSKLVINGKTILRLDNFVENLYKFKDDEDTKILFEDITFKNNYDTITSIDIEDSINKLQIFGAIGKLNPAYEKIVIYITQAEAAKFLDQYSTYNKALDRISKEF